MRKYYIKYDDNGEEVERKLTTNHELEDFESMNLEELAEVYYTATAELLSKASKVEMLENLILSKYEDDEQSNFQTIFNEACENIIIAQEKLN